MADFQISSQGISVAGPVSGTQLAGKLGSAQTIATAGTITTTNLGVLATVAAGAAVTGIIMQAGTVAGQLCLVVNQNATAASSITYAASGTSFVGEGTAAIISGSASRLLIWDGSVWW